MNPSESPRPVGESWNDPQSRAFAELLIDCEEDRTLRAVRIGVLREANKDSRDPHGVSYAAVSM